MGSKLYVGNLNYKTTEETLKSAFQSGQLEFKKIWELEG